MSKRRVRNNIITLDIGSKNIKVLVAKISNKEFNISKAFTFKTPVNSVEDGLIVDLDSLLITTKKELLKRDIRKGSMNISFSSSKIIERELELPVVNEKELNEVIRYEIKQYLPIDIDKYIISYKDVGQSNNNDIQNKQIMVSAIEKSIVQKYFNFVKELGFKPLYFDTQSNSLDKLLWFIENNYNKNIKTKTIAFIDFGNRMTSVSIFDKGAYKVSQVLNYGGSKIEEVIDNHVATATHLKGKEAIVSNLDTGVTKIQRVIRYFTTRYDANEINELYVYGGLTNLNGFCEYLENQFKVPVKNVNTLNFLEEEYPNFEFDMYVNCIGTIINKENMGKNQQYNFFEYFYKKIKIPAYLIYFLSIILILLSVVLYNYSRVNTLEKKIDDQTNQILQLDETNVLNKHKELKNKVENYKNLMKDIENIIYENSRNYWIGESVIDEIISYIPDGLTFNTMTLSNRSISISAVASERSIIAEYEHYIRSSNNFDNVYINNINYNSNIQSERYSFVITMDYIGGVDIETE